MINRINKNFYVDLKKNVQYIFFLITPSRDLILVVNGIVQRIYIYIL